MMSKARDRIIGIFIEESTEIIQQLETELIILEESPWDKSILNEIFRGVHTLKGNANSFGFVRLGEFVHYFEDYLDNFRKQTETLNDYEADLLIRGFDIVKEVFQAEESGNPQNPDEYSEVLAEIKKYLNKEDTTEDLTFELEEVVSKSEFKVQKITDKKEELLTFTDEILKKVKSENLTIYNIVMTFDDDLYTRGYNHQLFFKLFTDLGEIVYTYIKTNENTPILEIFDTDKSYIKEMSTYLISSSSFEEVQDVFEFIAQDEEVNISKIELDDILNQKQEVIQKELNLKNDQIKNIVENNSSSKVSTAPSASIRVESAKLDELFDSIGELVIAQSFISQNDKIKSINDKEINQYLEMLGKSTKIIQNKVMSLRMIPIRDTFLKMKRVARDVSKKTGKEIELLISGEETEIDKTMVDKLSEPLIHLLRNSIDHGIESNEDRIEAGKNSIGTVILSASHKGSNFVIEIKDDGAGIPKDKILAKAIERGIADENMDYSDDEILNFIFQAGFSTAEKLTDISGRGVGLDAVKTSIEEMRGKIQVDTKVGEGTSFRIILPLTLAIIDGLIVRLEGDTFIIPTLSVIESFRAKKSEIQQIKGKGEFIDYRGDILPIIRLNHLLELSDEKIPFEESTLICVEHERGKYVLQVNELLGRQQVVIKSLGKMMRNVKEISGAAILGSGNIALILNTEGIRDWLDLGDRVDNY